MDFKTIVSGNDVYIQYGVYDGKLNNTDNKNKFVRWFVNKPDDHLEFDQYINELYNSDGV